MYNVNRVSGDSSDYFVFADFHDALLSFDSCFKRWTLKMVKTLLLRNRRKFLGAVAGFPLCPACRTADAQDRPADSARVDALAETFRLRYGGYSSEGDMAEIRRGISEAQRADAGTGEDY